jgi:non-ribosomal peptide synthetase component F
VLELLLDATESADDITRQALQLRVVTVSGDRLTRLLVARFRRVLPGCRLINLYGTTEVCGDVTWHDATSGISHTPFVHQHTTYMSIQFYCLLLLKYACMA